jgi:hypothetical protein
MSTDDDNPLEALMAQILDLHRIMYCTPEDEKRVREAVECMEADHFIEVQASHLCPPGQILVAKKTSLPEVFYPEPLACTRCRGSRRVPDWTDWNEHYGEPRPKPCPDCAGGQ